MACPWHLALALLSVCVLAAVAAQLSLGPDARTQTFSDTFSLACPQQLGNGTWQVLGSSPGVAWQLVQDGCLTLGPATVLRLANLSWAGSLDTVHGLVPSAVVMRAAGGQLELEAVVLQTTEACMDLGQRLCSAAGTYSDVVVGQEVITIEFFSFNQTVWRNSSILCLNSSSSSQMGAISMRCAGAVVTSFEGLLTQVAQLQQTHTNITIQVPAETTITFRSSDLVISRSVTICSTAEDTVAWLDTQGLIPFVTVTDEPTALLTLSCVGIYNLAEGPDTSFPSSAFVGGTWGLNASRLVKDKVVYSNMVMILPEDLFFYIAWWYSQYLSPIPFIAATAAWLGDGGSGLPASTFLGFRVAVPKQGVNVVYNTYRLQMGRLWLNVTLGPPSTFNLTLLPSLDFTGIQQVGNNPYTSPPQVQTSVTLQQLKCQLGQATTARPYLVQVGNISFASVAGATALEISAKCSTFAVNAGVTLVDGVNVYWQSHPLHRMSIDFDDHMGAVQLGNSSTLTLHNLTLYNGGVLASGLSSDSGVGLALRRFSSALWAVRNVRKSDTSLVLDTVTLVVAPDELAVLVLFASNAQDTVTMSGLSAEEYSQLMQWSQQSQFTSISNTSLLAEVVAGWRWRGTNIRITSDSSAGAYLAHASPEAFVLASGSGNRPSSVPVAAYAVPVAVGGALLLGVGVWLILRRRRRQADQAKDGGRDDTYQDQVQDSSDHQMLPNPNRTGCSNMAFPPLDNKSQSAHEVELGASGMQITTSLELNEPAMPPRLTQHQNSADSRPGKLAQPTQFITMSSLEFRTGLLHALGVPVTGGSLESGGAGSGGAGSGDASWGDLSSGFQGSDSFERGGSEYGEPPTNLDESQIQALMGGARQQMESGAGQLSIYSVLGSGSNGVVYKGEWRGKAVAVKMLLLQEHRVCSSKQALQEVAIASRICAHPNLVQTFTFELKPITAGKELEGSGMAIEQAKSHTGDWKLFIVQEYCDAGHLKRMIDQEQLRGPDGLCMPKVVQLALDIACGVQHVHSRNVIHGDLSPANILLKSQDGRPSGMQVIAKVGDFGLSRSLAEDGGQSIVSNARQGTPFYTAPEVLLEGQLSRAADVFALGVLMHEMCCGTPVWRLKAKADARRAASRRQAPRTPATLVLSSNASVVEQAGSIVFASASRTGATEEMLPSLGSTPSQNTLQQGSGHISRQNSLSLPPLCESQGRGGKDSQHQWLQGQELETTSSMVLMPSGALLSPRYTPNPSHETLTARVTELQRWLMEPVGSYPLPFPSNVPEWYARLAANCMAARPGDRPKLPAIVTELLKQHAELLKLSAEPLPLVEQGSPRHSSLSGLAELRMPEEVLRH